MYRASETKLLDADELIAAKATMTEDQYNQEFECSWVANVPGSVFGKELQVADDKERITSVPYDPRFKVDTFWDLGMHDYTAILFAQSVGRGEIHIIDAYQNRGEGLPHYARILQERNYLYGTHYGRMIWKSVKWAAAKVAEKWHTIWASISAWCRDCLSKMAFMLRGY